MSYNYLPYYTTTLTIIVQLSVLLYNNSYTHCTTVVQLLYNYLPPGMNGLPQNMNNASTTHIRQHCCLTISICSNFGWVKPILRQIWDEQAFWHVLLFYHCFLATNKQNKKTAATCMSHQLSSRLRVVSKFSHITIYT